MSVKSPGILYDATNSWNGYNHQGKIALWYAISEIIKLYNPSLSQDENKEILKDYFLELEYFEDFSIGKTENDIVSYISVHQVKNLSDKNINKYESALLGLLSHFEKHQNITSAVLHTTVEIDLGKKTLLEHLKEIAKNSLHITILLNEINNNRNNPLFRSKLTECKRGRPTTLKSNLQSVLSHKYQSAKILTEENLDEAFDLYLKKLNNEKSNLKSLSESQIQKVSICRYALNNATTYHCSVDSALPILKLAIKTFYQKTSPGTYKCQDNFVDKSTLWILGQLDKHIIERDLNFDLYKKGVLERRINFSVILDWLMASDIDKHDDFYYLHYIKEGYFNKLERYCSKCNNNKCSSCNITECKNKLGAMDFEKFKQFVHVTNPTISGTLDQLTYPKYLSNGIISPFAKGLRDIPKMFETEKHPISYKDTNNNLCALTTIVGEGTDNDIALISSEILKNANIYSLLMDYDCLISKDVNINSVMHEEILQSHYFVSNQSEHIAHCKDVKVIALNDFIDSITIKKE